MGFLSSILGIFGFGIGIAIGFVIGFFFFIYSEPEDVEDPVIRPLHELDATVLQDIMPEIPLWVKSPDYDRVDWLNKFLLDLWPYLDKAICGIIRSTAKPIFAEYIGKFRIESIEFENLSLGTLPPIINGIKVYETNERELVMEPAIRWAGNPNVILVIKLMSLRITVQLVDLQIFVAPRIKLKPLVPTFPCFANITVSLMEKPHVDFGMKVLGADIMSIPGLYRFVQETIKKQVAILYLWPQTLQIPVLDPSIVATKKPVGVLHVKVVRATKLLKMDLLGLSDPYVKLRLSDDRLPAKKTSIKRKTLNPRWNENFKLIVMDPESQVLNIDVYDWDKVGGHDSLGMQMVPLKQLTPNETKEFVLDLVKHTSMTSSTSQKKEEKKQRGQIVVALTYDPFREDTEDFISGAVPVDQYGSRQSGNISRGASGSVSGSGYCCESPPVPTGGGLLMVTVYGAEDVEGHHHNNPYARVLFRGEEKKSKMIKKTRHPTWNEEFQFMLEEAPLNDEKIQVVVMSKRTGIGMPSSKKESLGHVDIHLGDVVYNGRINQKYHLIDSKNGVIHVELGWKTVTTIV